MTDQTAIVVHENVGLGVLEVASKEVVARATAIAKELAKVVKDRNLYKEIQGKTFVRVEGWSTLGAMLGVLPRETGVTEDADGSFTAAVELIRTSDSRVVGGASAICGMDEPLWAKRTRNARRSMALTRATGKAYRLGFAWIMALAGYETTPAEEMPSDEEDGRGAIPVKATGINPPAPPTKAPTNSVTWDAYWKEIHVLGLNTNDGNKFLEDVGAEKGGPPDSTLLAKALELARASRK